MDRCGQGTEFGTYVLLRPEWINVYGSGSHSHFESSAHQLGLLARAKHCQRELIFQTTQADGIW